MNYENGLQMYTNSLCNINKILKTGCTSIDHLLNGGIPVNMITEFVGEASCGKTQICLQLLLQVQLPYHLGGLNGSSCYITTEGKSCMKRLKQLSISLKERIPDFIKENNKYNNRYNTIELLNHIFIEQAFTIEDLIDILHCKLPTLLEENNVKLVIIDSIAGLFRYELNNNQQELHHKSKILFGIANCMRILSAEYNVVFITTNQVTRCMINNQKIVNQRHYTELTGLKTDNKIVNLPALGLSWSNCLNQRFIIERCDRIKKEYHSDEANMNEQQIDNFCVPRRLQIQFSPYLESGYCYFKINDNGIVSIDKDTS